MERWIDKWTDRQLDAWFSKYQKPIPFPRTSKIRKNWKIEFWNSAISGNNCSKNLSRVALSQRQEFISSTFSFFLSTNDKENSLFGETTKQNIVIYNNYAEIIKNWRREKIMTNNIIIKQRICKSFINTKSEIISFSLEAQFSQKSGR